jgi:acetyltransferase-like isoleucine patch superfamily enzyme
VTIPGSVTHIEESPDKVCTQKQKGKNSALKLLIGSPFPRNRKLTIYGPAGSCAAQHAEKYDIPMYAFAGNGLIKKVTLNNVGVIGDCAFKDAIALEEVSIASTTTAINKEAFSGCVNLKGVTFEANSTLVDLGESVFKGCANLKSVVIGNNCHIATKVVLLGCKISDGITIGANSCVSKDLEKSGLYVNQPLRYIESYDPDEKMNALGVPDYFMGGLGVYHERV